MNFLKTKIVWEARHKKTPASDGGGSLWIQLITSGLLLMIVRMEQVVGLL